MTSTYMQDATYNIEQVGMYLRDGGMYTSDRRIQLAQVQAMLAVASEIAQLRQLLDVKFPNATL